jgi:putative ABC transport system ATP-binding protein
VGAQMTEPLIELNNLQFRWRPADPLVIDIPELKIAAGERVFIQGSSGSGKTTLLNLLGGFMLPQSGKITVLGQELTEMSGSRRDKFRSDHIGFIFQMFNLVPYLSVIENVTLPCRFSGHRQARSLQNAKTIATEAERLLKHMTIGDLTLMEKSAAELSMGQQQRVAAARALIGCPNLIIADEPTSSLDADARSAFLDLLFTEVAASGSTLIFVSHDANLAPSFDRTLAFADLNRAY